MNTESKSAKQKGKLSAFEPYALMAYDIAATFIAVFVASWGTQHWATLSGAAGACPAILVLALVNVVVFWFFHMYSSLWRYASISEAGRIVAAVTVGSVIGDVIFNVLFGKGMSLREDVMAWAVVLIICGGGRFAIRAIYGSQLWRFKSNSDAHLPRTLIVGAGETGSLSIKRMLNDQFLRERMSLAWCLCRITTASSLTTKDSSVAIFLRRTSEITREMFQSTKESGKRWSILAKTISGGSTTG